MRAPPAGRARRDLPAHTETRCSSFNSTPPSVSWCWARQRCAPPGRHRRGPRPHRRRPLWQEESRRVGSLEVVPLAEPGPAPDRRDRPDSGLPRRLPYVVSMLDDAFAMVRRADQPAEDNFVRAHAQADLAAHGDWRGDHAHLRQSRAYGAGLLPLIESGNLAHRRGPGGGLHGAAVFAYGRGLEGRAAGDARRANDRRINVAAEKHRHPRARHRRLHDYFEYHGGMVATVRALTGTRAAASIGDSTTRTRVRTWSLTEETAGCSSVVGRRRPPRCRHATRAPSRWPRSVH